MSSGLAMKLNAEKAEHWASANGGKEAARRQPEWVLNAVRHVGSVELHLSAADGAGAARSLLGLDEKAPKARVPDVKWTRVPGKAPLHPSAAPLERWDEDTGEFVGQGFGSPAAILQAIHAGELLCDEPWADQFLEALGAH